jgi:large-conductance mechanosensitive channel
MKIPHLVEHNIKNVISYNLKTCHEIKNEYSNFIYNICCFLLLCVTIYIILKSKYKNNTKEERQNKENKKRDYILYNLRKFQNIKNKHITNIPIYT